MDHQSVNLLEPSNDLHLGDSPAPLPKKTRRLLPRAFHLALLGFCLLVVSGFLFFAGMVKTAGYDEGEPLSLFATLSRLVLSGDKDIAGESEDRVNILLLGVGGSGHEGPELTDTMMFGSFRPSTKELGLISIPRDLTVFVDGYGYRKINAVNALAEQKKKGSGRQAAAEAVEQVLGQKIPYTVKVDFNGFADVIDALGGIDVYIERSFTDPTFPLDDGLGGTEVISFAQGYTHLDGKTALKYARSRHGNNGEGSDFARAARQQKILLALKDRALSMDVILNPGKLSRIMSIIQENVETNMTAFEMIKFAKYVPDLSTDRIALHVLDSASGLLYETYVNGAYVLLPYEDDWSDLHALATNIYAHDVPGARTPLTVPKGLTPGGTLTVEIQNGTLTTGLAGTTAELLQASGFTVSLVVNAENRNTEKTTVYDFTAGKKSAELFALKDYLHADVIMTKTGSMNTHAVLPVSLIDEASLKAMKKSETPIDFLIVLGQDSTSLVLR